MKTITKFIIVLLIVGLPVLYILVRSGLVVIPVASAILYNEPTPVHAVSPSGSLNEVLETQLNAFAASRFTSGSLVGEQITFALPESAMTAALQPSIESSVSKTFIANKSQIAVVEGVGLEAYLPFQHGSGRTALIILFNFDLENGELKPHVQEFKLGQLHLPRAFMNFAIRESQKAWLAPLNEHLKTFLQIQAIEYGTSSMNIQGTLTSNGN